MLRGYFSIIHFSVLGSILLVDGSLVCNKILNKMQCLIVQVVFDPALRERHIGDLQGMKFQDAATERPEAYKAFVSHKRNQPIPVSVIA